MVSSHIQLTVVLHVWFSWNDMGNDLVSQNCFWKILQDIEVVRILQCYFITKSPKFVKTNLTKKLHVW